MNIQYDDNAPSWLPVRFKQAGPHIFVHLIDATKLDFSFGFFTVSLKALTKKNNPGKIILLDEWLKSRETNFSSENVNLIFHTARCGSTLLCQNLKTTDKFIVLGEPSFLGHIYKYLSISKEKRKKILRKSCMEWNQWAKGQNKSLVIKVSSSLTPIQQELRHDLQNCKAVFLYREPIASIESLSRKPPGYFKKKFSNTENIFSKELFEKHTKNILQAAEYYSETLEQIPQITTAGTLIIDYSELSIKYKEILNFFDISPIKNNNETPQWETHWYSKNDTSQKKKYTPISMQKIEQFRSTNAKIIKPLIGKYEVIKNADKS